MNEYLLPQSRCAAMVPRDNPQTGARKVVEAINFGGAHPWIRR